MTPVTKTLLQLREHQQAQFWKECRTIWDTVEDGGRKIKDMLRQAEDVPVGDFTDAVNLMSWPGVRGYGDDPFAAFHDDPGTRFCRSQFDGKPCYFIQYCGFEILFL